MMDHSMKLEDLAYLNIQMHECYGCPIGGYFSSP